MGAFRRAALLLFVPGLIACGDLRGDPNAKLARLAGDALGYKVAPGRVRSLDLKRFLLLSRLHSTGARHERNLRLYAKRKKMTTLVVFKQGKRKGFTLLEGKKVSGFDLLVVITSPYGGDGGDQQPAKVVDCPVNICLVGKCYRITLPAEPPCPANWLKGCTPGNDPYCKGTDAVAGCDRYTCDKKWGTCTVYVRKEPPDCANPPGTDGTCKYGERCATEDDEKKKKDPPVPAP